ncbi:hypothetical protein LCGC14_2406520 [marine sediment metagenome]|uniref:Uncharacterized protein n=1 Tax=marine sediment metagenome TaxID=412755 RepID=A0A0F9BTQ3_9ZZZZ
MPEQHRDAVQEAYTLKALRDRLFTLSKQMSYRQMARTLYDDKVTHATLHRIVKYGSEPKDLEARRVLGLPTPVTIYQGPDGRFVKR